MISRILTSVAVSTTVSTLEFGQWQMIRTNDAYSDEPRFRDIHVPWKAEVKDREAKMMNDVGFS